MAEHPPLRGSAETELPSKDELAMVEQVSANAAKKLSEMSLPLPWSWPADVGGDLRVTRYLRSANGDVERASELLANALIWRATADEQVKDIHKEVSRMTMEEFAEYHQRQPERKWMKGAFLGRAVNGDLVHFVEIGTWDVELAVSVLTATRINEGIIATAEFLMAQLDRLSREGDRMYYTVGIVDLEGLGPHHLWGDSKEWFQGAVDLFSHYYRDATTVVIVVNAPLLFRAVWAIISGFLTQRQQQKACVLGRGDDPDVQNRIQTLVPKEILPRSLGGLGRVLKKEEEGRVRKEQLRSQNTSIPKGGEPEPTQVATVKPSGAIGRVIWEGKWFMSVPLFVLSHPVFFLLAPWFLAGWPCRRSS